MGKNLSNLKCPQYHKINFWEKIDKHRNYIYCCKKKTMYNIFLRYENTVKQVETTEELFNLHNKMEHMARIQWDKENEFDDLCDEVDRRVLELAKETFNFETTDNLGVEYFRPSIGQDDMYSYVNVLVVNHNNNNIEEFSEVMDINSNPWLSICDNL